jgi:hypothetical protein
LADFAAEARKLGGPIVPRAKDGETVKVDQMRLNTRTVHRHALQHP